MNPTTATAIELSEEQLLLVETASKVLERSVGDDGPWPPVAGLVDGLASAWSSLVESGLVGLLVPEELGGTGGTTLDACLVAEQVGRHLVPLPYVATAIAAPCVLDALGGAGDLPARIVAGQQVALLVGPDHVWPSPRPTVAWGWTRDAVGIGTDEAGGAREVELGGAVHRSFDERFAWYAEVRDLGPASVPRFDAVDLAVARIRLGCAAELLGLAQAALDEATAYAAQREQYGRPIGSFQAVQHLCAGMLVDVETTRSAVVGVAGTVDQTATGEAVRAAAVAKAWASDAGVRVCETAIQVLGGIGITWEHPAHVRLRRAHILARSFGDVASLHRSLGKAFVDHPREIQE